MDFGFFSQSIATTPDIRYNVVKIQAITGSNYEKERTA